jgi:pimeloyl-ACP methyl ester carboxylesterase
MNPFYFGTSERRLFGIYEPPAFGAGGKRAALLCYPWGPEYLHSHRTMRQLALRLAAAGFHTLRFDYYGSGDSGAEPTDTDLKGWELDIELAMQETRDIAGVTKIALIGLRLGATAAAAVASRMPGKIDALVLWDPVVSGEEYLRLLGAPSNDGTPFEALGFTLPQIMIRELVSLDLGALKLENIRRKLVLITDHISPNDSARRIADLGYAKSGEIELMTDVLPWIEISANTGMVPYSVIQRIVTWLD